MVSTMVLLYFQKILKELDIVAPMITTDDFMERFCNNLGLTRTLGKIAQHIAKSTVDMDIAPGKSPISIAAAAIYVSTMISKHEKKSLQDIADVAGVATSTIAQTYKLIVPRVWELIPKHLQTKISHEKSK